MNCEDRSLVQVKSKFEHEFRRFSVGRSTLTFAQLRNQVLEAHRLPKTDDIVMVYLNPASRDVVPLTDDASLASAIGGVSPLLRLFLHRRSHNRTAEYESESDGHCSECSSDSDIEDVGRGEGGAGDRSQQSESGGGGAGDRSQQSGSGGGGAGGDSTLCTVNSSAQGRKAQHCSKGSGCRAGNGSSDGGEVSCAGREARSELSSDNSPNPEGERGSSHGSEQSRTRAGTGCEPVGTDCHPAFGENGLEPHPPGAEGKDSRNWRGCVCQLGTELSQDQEARDDSASCVPEFGHVLPGPSVISDEQQGPPQLCQALPVHPLLPTSSCPSTNAECGPEFHPKTASTSPDDPIAQNIDTVLRVTADMLPPHPLLAATGKETTPPSNKTTPPLRNTTPPAQQTTEDKFPYVVEIYDFDACLKTRDLLTELGNNCRPEEFRLKWVDDTHALGIFASSEKAWLVTRVPYQQFKTRLVREGTEQSRAMAERLAADMQPSGHCASAPRPKHTAMVARRMVASALGVRVRVSPEQRQRESQELQQARARKQVLRATAHVIPG